MCLLKTWFLEIRSFFLNHKIWFFSIWLLLIVHWSHQRTLTFISCNFHIKNMSHVPYLDCLHCIMFCRNMSPTMQLWIKLWTLFELYENVLLKSCVVVQMFRNFSLATSRLITARCWTKCSNCCWFLFSAKTLIF